jgi:hypothetical protein
LSFLLVVQALVYYLLAAIIFWQRRDEWLTVIVVMFFLAAPTNSLNQPVAALPPVLQGALAWAQFLGIATFILIGLLFPNGHFVPCWTAPLAAGLLLIIGVQIYVPQIAGPLGPIGTLMLLACAQIYRYRKVSSREQRQQTKWFVLGLTGTVVVNVVYHLLPLFFPPLAQRMSLKKI